MTSLSGGWTPAAYAQTAPRSGVIRNIVVEGNQRIEPTTIASYLTVAPGDPFDLGELNRTLRTLFATGLFKDADLLRRGDTLVVRVVENPIVNRVAFEGNKRLDDEELEAEIQLRPRIVYTAAKAQADAQRLIQLYRQSGRFSARVEPKIVELPQNRVDLVFEIVEGDQTGVAGVNFLGNRVFDDDALRGAIATKESRFFRFFTSNDNYDPNRLEFDKEQLRQYYADRGYADFRPISAIAELTPDQDKFFITFIVEEGPLYTFGEIKVTTELDRLNADFLKRLVSTREGETFNGTLIENSIDSLTFAAGAAGYAFVDIRPVLERNASDGTIDVTFDVREGPRVYVDRIEINGNVRTQDYVIRREMQIIEGDAFSRTLLERSRARIRGLGFFSEVEVEERPGAAPDRTTIDVTVEEQATGELSVSAGFSSTQAFLFDFGISQRNLLGRGQQLRLNARIAARTRQFVLSFREPYFLNRRLAAGVDLFRSRQTFRTTEADFSNTSTGITLSTGFPVARDVSLRLSYSFRRDRLDLSQQFGGCFGSFELASSGESLTPIFDENDRLAEDQLEAQLLDQQRALLRDVETGEPIFNEDDQLAVAFLNPSTELRPGSDQNGDGLPDDLIIRNFVTGARGPESATFIPVTCIGLDRSLTSEFTAGLAIDKRNDPIRPSRGWLASITTSIAGAGGDNRYIRTEFQARWYRRLFFDDVVFSIGPDVGYVRGLGQALRTNARFRIGGENFRGFEFAGVGPRDLRGTFGGGQGRNVAVGGNFYAVGRAELQFPLGLPESYGIRGGFFADVGTVGLVDEELRVEGIEDDLALRATAGASVFWRSPFGPIRLDFAHIIKREDFDQLEQFRFGATTAF